MSRILAIETATSCCSAALCVDGKVVSRNEVGNNIHSSVLLSMVEELLSEAQLNVQQLDAIAVGQGPGSFTGLRIGVGVGQGLAFGANCPMIGISSLDALALQTKHNGLVIAAIDARMGEVYWCEYLKNGAQLTRLQPLNVSVPADVYFSRENSHAGSAIVGNAWSAYRDKFSGVNSAITVIDESVIYPDSTSLLLLAEQSYLKGNGVPASEFAPIYVRNDVAKKSTKPLPGRRPKD